MGTGSAPVAVSNVISGGMEAAGKARKCKNYCMNTPLPVPSGDKDAVGSWSGTDRESSNGSLAVADRV